MPRGFPHSMSVEDVLGMTPPSPLPRYIFRALSRISKEHKILQDNPPNTFRADSLQEHHTNGNRDNSSTPNITTETNQVTEQHSLASPYRDVSTSSPIVIPSKRVATTSNLPSHFCRPAASPPPPKTATCFGKRRLNSMTPTANNQESDESIPTIEDMDNPTQPPTAPLAPGLGGLLDSSIASYSTFGGFRVPLHHADAAPSFPVSNKTRSRILYQPTTLLYPSTAAQKSYARILVNTGRICSGFPLHCISGLINIVLNSLMSNGPLFSWSTINRLE